MKSKQWLVVAVCLIATACSRSGFETTETGLEYKIVKCNADALKPVSGDVIALRITCYSESGRLLESTPLFKIKLKDAPAGRQSIEEGLLMMHKGDSIVLRMAAHLYAINPEIVPADSLLQIAVKMVDVIPKAEFERDINAARIAGERDEDRLLSEYIKKNNITTEPEISGLYYIETKKGSGLKPVPGKMVAIHYEGYFLNGQVFDSSYGRNKPLEFKLGAMQVIQGLEEGVARMCNGGRATLIIPSALAYGDQQVGPVPPFATLIFDVELVGVEK